MVYPVLTIALTQKTYQYFILCNTESKKAQKHNHKMFTENKS